jgi:hypothetical protein
MLDGRVYSEMPIWTIAKRRGVSYIIRGAFKTGVKDERRKVVRQTGWRPTGHLMPPPLSSGRRPRAFFDFAFKISMTARDWFNMASAETPNHLL